MLRASFIAAAACAALGSAAVASADDCMCAVPIALAGVELDAAQIEAIQIDELQLEGAPVDAAQLEAMQLTGIVDDGLVDGSRLQSVEVGPFFSSDGTMLMSRLRLERTEARGWRVARQRPSEDVLFCASADDPRCSPAAPAPEDGPRGTRANPFGASPADRPMLPPPAAVTTASPDAATGPRDGVRLGLERPPRA